MCIKHKKLNHEGHTVRAVSYPMNTGYETAKLHEGKAFVFLCGPSCPQWLKTSESTTSTHEPKIVAELLPLFF